MRATYTAVHGIPDLVGSSVKGSIRVHCQRLCIFGSNRVPNVHLESEGTGEDGGQVYRISVDQAPVNRKK